MLERHLFGRPAKIGVGANRAAVAASYFERYGYFDPRSSPSNQSLCLDQKVESHLNLEKIGAVILDDGMQVLYYPLYLLPIVGTQSSSISANVLSHIFLSHVLFI